MDLYTLLKISLIIFIFLKLLKLYRKDKIDFSAYGVKLLEPPIPYCCNNIKALLGLEHLMDFIKNAYKECSDHRYVALYDRSSPVILIKDLELIKSIAIKDFESFHDHKFFAENNETFSKSLFSLKGEEWKDMRVTLSPIFSSSKLKNMMSHIEDCAKIFCNHFIEKLKKSGNSTIDFEIKDTFAKFTTDAITTSVYGIQLNSFENVNNEFYKLSKLLNSSTFIDGMRMSFVLSFPSIAKFLNIKLFSGKLAKFFNEVVINSMQFREDNGIFRNDMIQLFLEARKGKLKRDANSEPSIGFAAVEETTFATKETTKRSWSDDYFAAQALIFFFGGFDTTSTTIMFFFYEILKNPSIQVKLQEEIDEFWKQANGELNYYDLQKLKYLDMCLSETLRLWPQGFFLDRVCSKSYTLPPSSNKTLKTFDIPPNMSVWIPVLGIHHDPQYYPDPLKFIPERFSEENKSSINPYTFLPFGIGPRNCIGSRYALMTAKIIIFYTLLNFSLTVTEKTEIPLKLKNRAFNIALKNGLWAGLKKRNIGEYN